MPEQSLSLPFLQLRTASGLTVMSVSSQSSAQPLEPSPSLSLSSMVPLQAHGGSSRWRDASLPCPQSGNDDGRQRERHRTEAFLGDVEQDRALVPALPRGVQVEVK